MTRLVALVGLLAALLAAAPATAWAGECEAHREASSYTSVRPYDGRVLFRLHMRTRSRYELPADLIDGGWFCSRSRRDWMTRPRGSTWRVVWGPRVEYRRCWQDWYGVFAAACRGERVYGAIIVRVAAVVENARGDVCVVKISNYEEARPGGMVVFRHWRRCALMDKGAKA